VTGRADSVGGPAGAAAAEGAAGPGPGRPRVALVLGTSSGGVGRHVAMLAAGLATAGASVSVYGPPATLQSLAAGRPLPAAALVPVDITSRPRPRDALTLLRLRRLLAVGPDDRGLTGGGRLDVIHAHGLRAGAMAVLAGRRRPARVIVTVHNAPPAGRGTAALVYRVLEVIVARGADLTLCVSADLERRMRRAGARQVAAAVVPAPAAAPAAAASRDQASSSPAPATSPAPARALASAGGPARPVVLAVGRLAPQKGLGTLLAAAACWRDMDPVPRLVIAGQGPLLGRLRDQAASLGVDAEFLGHRDDVPALLAGCDVFALASRWEGQPLAVQEALRAGAAIVATRVGGIPDLVGPHGAYLVRPDAPADLAAAVRAVLTSESLAAGLRAAAMRRAQSLPAEQDAIAAARAAYAIVQGRPGQY
jgi:glycosyltransferase involved in cell wall biosynthesis